MMKKVIGIVICLFSFTFLMTCPVDLEAKTLREMKEELAEAKANKAANEAKRKAAQAKIKEYNETIAKSTKDIENCENEIEEARQTIIKLEADIVEKQKEIDELLKFLQVSNGENIYLEYIFGASDFTDFIYRTAIVEQLSNHNDKLIDEMHQMIEENKILQEELAKKIKELEKKIEDLKKQLASLNITIDDIDDHQKDIEAEIKATEAEVKYYEQYGCKLDQEISDCLNVPYANGFTRPTDSGYISSNFGYRYIWGSTSFHRGIDIATPEGTKVYASAPGYVAKKVIKSSCGGNIVYIQHTVNGKKYTTSYNHLKSFNVNVGDMVFLNTVIGYSGGGSSTMSYDTCTTGAHLHFSIFNGWTTAASAAVDPRGFVNFPAKGSRYYSRW